MPLIDVHQHVIPDIYKNELARVGVMGSGENPWPAWSMARQLELMDEHKIDAVVLSIASPGAYFGDVAFTKRLVKACNETMMQMVNDHPGKFGAMGFVSLPDVAAACRDVEYALDVLKMDGINLQSHTGERYLGDPEENELYAELDRRRAVIFVHPQRPHATGMPRYAFPAGYTELTFDTTRAITNMLYTGMLEKFPNIRWIMPHMGGVAPFLLFRLSGIEDDPKARDKVPQGRCDLSQPALVRRRAVTVAAGTQCAARDRRSFAHPVWHGLPVRAPGREGDARHRRRCAHV